VSAHQTQKTTVSSHLWIVLLPGVEKVLVHASNHVEAIRHDRRVREGT
jgi:hypothetical protein